ncbi:TPA: RNA polymerase subunit sigma-24, partial [Candidatus Poribacteria bacterium]|nr:RNA polymerase subunit sigma-24 [Candidatus Poribacteria bacterium]
MSDLRTLIDRSIGGDMDAFGELMLKYQNAVYSIALSILGDFMLAEDVTQEVFISVYQNLFTLSDADNFPHWLRAITLNTCRALLREPRRG